MIIHREPPEPWRIRRAGVRNAWWWRPFCALNWTCDWLAFVLSRWSFLAVLEYMGSFSILIAVIFYFSESGDRLKQKHYQAWQVINTAQNKGGSGGRIEALQELDEDGVPLVGVDVSGAFLQGIRLPGAKIVRSNLTGVDARNGDFQGADFTAADLAAGNFRQGNFSRANLQDADLSNADFCRADLSGASFDGATLDGADLGHSDLRDINWQKIKSVKGTTLEDVRNPPSGFLEWASQHGAILKAPDSDCP